MINKRTERAELNGFITERFTTTTGYRQAKKVQSCTVVTQKNKNGEIEPIRYYETERFVR